MEWQPIKTAPKDSMTRILGYFTGGRIGVLSWTGWGGGCWQCAFTGHNVMDTPTHWMLLPAPPQSVGAVDPGGELAKLTKDHAR